MSYREHAISFRCEDDALVGIVSLPAHADSSDGPACDTGVVIIVGGPQYRAGSHRQFTLLARALATEGTPVLRFDYRGMGDSTGVQRDFEAVSDDVACAIDAFMLAVPKLRNVLLWGLCDGASAALLYLHERGDARVKGLCLLNPWVRSTSSLARTHVRHYYLDRLKQPEFWRKLVSGQVAGKAIRDLWTNLLEGRAQGTPGAGNGAFQDRMARAWAAFEGPSLLVLSGSKDYTAREFSDHCETAAAWLGLVHRPQVTRYHAENADHTFSDDAERRAVERETLQHVVRTAATAARPSPDR